MLAFGTSLAGFRFLAAAAQSVVVVLTAAMARRMGGGRASQWIAAIAIAISPMSIASSALFQYVAFDYLWWVLIAYFVVRLIDSDDPRWWMAIGAVIGLGVMTKYTIAFLVAGLVAGVFTSPLRRHMRSRWLWIGAAVSVVIVVPHFAWQASHDFITLDFLKHIHARDVAIGRTSGFFVDQLLVCANPVTIPLWVTGLVALFVSPRLRRYRTLGWMAVVPFLLFVIAHGRGYYLGPVYPMLLAAGAVEMMNALDRWTAIARRAALAFVAVVLAAGSAVAFAILPVAPLDSALGRFAISKNGDLKEEVGWPEMTAEVARIWRSIPERERRMTAIYCSNYGEAGAIDLYGPAYGLPRAISGINSYWARGYGNPPPQTVIVLGSRRSGLEERFTSVTLAGRIPNPHHLDNEEAGRAEIFICRGLRTPWPILWAQIRSFG